MLSDGAVARSDDLIAFGSRSESFFYSIKVGTTRWVGQPGDPLSWEKCFPSFYHLSTSLANSEMSSKWTVLVEKQINSVLHAFPPLPALIFGMNGWWAVGMSAFVRLVNRRLLMDTSEFKLKSTCSSQPFVDHVGSNIQIALPMVCCELASGGSSGPAVLHVLISLLPMLDVFDYNKCQLPRKPWGISQAKWMEWYLSIR